MQCYVIQINIYYQTPVISPLPALNHTANSEYKIAELPFLEHCSLCLCEGNGPARRLTTPWNKNKHVSLN